MRTGFGWKAGLCLMLCVTGLAAEELELDIDVTADAGQHQATDSPLRFHVGALQSWQNPGSGRTLAQYLDLKVQYEDWIKQRFFTVMDYSLRIRSRSDVQNEKDESFEFDNRIQALFVQASQNQFSMKLGYQTLSWGKMDMLGVSDQFTPWDYSQFAFTAPQDARVAQAVLVASHFIQQGLESEFIYNMDPKVSRYPGGDALYLLQQSLGPSVGVREHKPKAFSDYELALRLKLNRENFDAAFTVARLLQNDPVFLLSGPLQFDAVYPEYTLLAYSYNFPGDGRLWKLGVALSLDKSYSNFTNISKADSIQWGVGVDINQGDEYSVSLEAAYTYTDLPDSFGMDTNATKLAMRASKDFMHNTFSSVYYFQYYIEDHAQTHSLSLRYSIRDDWSVELVQTVFKVTDQSAPSYISDDWDSLSLSTILSW